MDILVRSLTYCIMESDNKMLNFPVQRKVFSDIFTQYELMALNIFEMFSNSAWIWTIVCHSSPTSCWNMGIPKLQVQNCSFFIKKVWMHQLCRVMIFFKNIIHSLQKNFTSFQMMPCLLSYYCWLVIYGNYKYSSTLVRWWKIRSFCWLEKWKPSALCSLAVITSMKISSSKL